MECLNVIKHQSLLKLCFSFIVCTSFTTLSACNRKQSINNLSVTSLDPSNISLEVTILDTGKSDCIFIEIGDKTIMIDTGLDRNGEQILASLHEKGIDHIDYLILTHLDKDHIHNHILLNSTSFIDGKRFCNTKKDYWNMRNASDELCKEYGLSIIEDPSYDSKKMNYHVMKTYMNDTKKDIDALVKESNCIRDLKDNMKKKGYEIDRIDEEDVIFHPYCNEPIYLKSLGERYHLDEIEERLTDKWILPQNVEHTRSYYQCKEYYQLYKR